MSLSSQKVQKRALSAAIIAPFILGVIWYGQWPFAAMLGVVSGLALAELYGLAKGVVWRWPCFLTGVVYIFGGVFLCFHLRHIYGFELTMIFLLAVWASDIGAYFAGKFLGGRKMSPVISPNKTWAGYWGALYGPAILLSLALLQLDHALILGGIAMGIAGQAGDLLASWLKRKAHVKNASELIPGHGGVMDRLDSVLPAVCIYLAMIKAGVIFW